MSLVRIKTNESAASTKSFTLDLQRPSNPADPQLDTTSANSSFDPLQANRCVGDVKEVRGFLRTMLNGQDNQWSSEEEEAPNEGGAKQRISGAKYKKRNNDLTETITEAQSYLRDQEWKAFLDDPDVDLDDEAAKSAVSELNDTDVLNNAISQQLTAADSVALTDALMALDTVMIPILRLNATRPSINTRQQSITVTSSGKGKGALTLSPEEATLFELFRALSSVPNALGYQDEFRACLTDLNSTGNSKLDELESHLQTVLRRTEMGRTADAQYSLGDACQTVKSHWRQTIADRTSSKH